RGILLRERLEFPIKRREGLLREAGADLSDVVELRAAVCAEQERSEVGSRAGRRRVASDDELLLLVDLHFQPLRAPPLAIRRGGILGDDSLPPLLPSLPVGLPPVEVETPRREEMLRVADRFLELAPAHRKRLVPQVPAVAVQAVEDGVDRGPIALLQQLEA